VRCGENRVARLMRENGIEAKQQRAFKTTTDSDHNLPVAPNVLDRQFEADAPNEKWTCDIISVYTKEGWLYLASIKMGVGHCQIDKRLAGNAVSLPVGRKNV